MREKLNDEMPRHLNLEALRERVLSSAVRHEAKRRHVQVKSAPSTARRHLESLPRRSAIAVTSCALPRCSKTVRCSSLCEGCPIICAASPKSRFLRLLVFFPFYSSFVPWDDLSLHESDSVKGARHRTQY